MKKQLVARGIAGALSLCGVLGLVGCGAEGADEAAEIGSTAQAIIAADVDSVGPTLSTGVAYQSACAVTVAAEEYILQIGGEKAGAAYSRDVQVMRVSNGVVTNIANVLPAGLSRGQAITKPTDASKCIFFGGEGASSTYSNAVTQLTLAVNGSNVPTGITTATVGTNTTMSAARSRFRLIPCGTNRVLIAGGGNGTSGALNLLEHWDATNGILPLKDSNNDTVTLNTGRREFAIAQLDSTHSAVFGGIDSTSGKLNSIEKLVMNASCDLTTNPANNKATLSAQTLHNARSGLEAFYLSHVAANQDKFVVAAGEDGTFAAVNDHDEVLLDWVTNANDLTTNPMPTTVTTATKSPTLAIAGTGHAFLFGGVGVNDMQEYNAGWNAVTVDKVVPVPNTLDVREGATSTLSANGKFYVAGGFDGANYLTSTLKITP